MNDFDSHRRYRRSFANYSMPSDNFRYAIY